MTTKTPTYREGDYFLVPLHKEVYVLGLVTRWDEGGYVIGFFFELGTMEIPTSDTPKSFHYRPEDAIDILRFGDNFLLDGTWPIVGYASSWNRNEWAVTKFALGESKINLFQIRHYDPDKPFYKPVKIENVTPDAIIGLPTDSSHGSKAAVYHLARLLQERYPVLNRKNVDAFYDELAKANQGVGYPESYHIEDQHRHAVLVYWKLDNNQFGSPETYQTIQRLMDKLETSFAERDDIEFDGDEIGEGYATFFFYGSNADAMFSEITRVIKRFKPPKGSYAIKRYGKVGSKEVRVNIS